MSQSFLKRRRVLVLETGELPLLLQADLELRQVEILRVVEALQEQPVHDLGQRLVAAADAAVGRDVEDHGVGRDLLVDAFSRTCELVVAGALGEALAAPTPRATSRLAIERPSILAKLDLPEPKKPETQMAMPSWGLFGVSR